MQKVFRAATAFCASLIVILALTNPAFASAQVVKRTLIFPKEYSIGMVYLIRDDETAGGFRVHRRVMKRINIAQGQVSVDLHAHEGVLLELNGKFFQEPDSIRFLKPDSLERVRMQFRAMEDSETPVLARALVSLARLTKVRELDFGKSDVDDAGLLRVAKDMTELECINVESTFITGASLAKLTNCKKLRELYCQGDQLKPESLRSLSNFPKLEAVNLSATRLNDAGLRNLSGCAQVIYLRLNKNPGLTDRSVPVLLTMPKLHALELNNTLITADGLAKLRGLPLQTLAFTAEMCTPAQTAKLRTIFGKACATGPGKPVQLGDFEKTIFAPITRD